MILQVFRASWLNLRRDPVALVMSFVMPVIFFSIFAGIFAPANQSAGTRKIPMIIVDQDHSERSARFVAALEGETALRARTTESEKAEENAPAVDEATATEMVRRGDVPIALVIPKGFSEWKMQFDQRSGVENSGSIRLLADTSDPVATEILKGLIQKITMTALPDLFLRGGVDAMDSWSGGLDSLQRARLDMTLEEITRQSRTRVARPGTETPSGFVSVEVRDVLGEKKRNPVVAFYAAGIGVLFLLFTASNAGGAILEENESGTLDRILTTRVSMSSLLFGKLLYLTSLGVAQLFVMFLWGAFAFKLELFSHIVGFTIVSVATALATSAFGLVLASVSRTRSQLGAVSMLVVLSISALGGSMFPRFLMPESLKKGGLVLFNSWALDAFTKVFWRESPLVDLWPQVTVLVGTAIVFFALARRFCRRWETS